MSDKNGFTYSDVKKRAQLCVYLENKKIGVLAAAQLQEVCQALLKANPPGDLIAKVDAMISSATVRRIGVFEDEDDPGFYEIGRRYCCIELAVPGNVDEIMRNLKEQWDFEEYMMEPYEDTIKSLFQADSCYISHYPPEFSVGYYLDGELCPILHELFQRELEAAKGIERIKSEEGFAKVWQIFVDNMWRDFR